MARDGRTFFAFLPAAAETLAKSAAQGKNPRYPRRLGLCHFLVSCLGCNFSLMRKVCPWFVLCPFLSSSREKDEKSAAQGKNPRFFPWESFFLNVRGSSPFCDAPDARTVSVLHPCPQARHNRTALAVGSPISPWDIGFAHGKCTRGICPLWVSRDWARDALRGCTETFSDARSPW